MFIAWRNIKLVKKSHRLTLKEGHKSYLETTISCVWDFFSSRTYPTTLKTRLPCYVLATAKQCHKNTLATTHSNTPETTHSTLTLGGFFYIGSRFSVNIGLRRVEVRKKLTHIDKNRPCLTEFDCEQKCPPYSYSTQFSSFRFN